MPRTKGSGKPKGYKTQRTLDKLEARELVRKHVTAELGPLVEAQIKNAKGIQHFMLRDKAGRFEKVSSEAAALAALNDPESVYDFWTKDPSVPAFTDLLNRALDKPKEQAMEFEVNVTTAEQRVGRLLSARKRLKS